MILLVWPRTQAQSDGKRKSPFLFLNMWEVDLPQEGGFQENKGVFLSLTLGSAFESSLALRSSLIAGGLKATWGPLDLLSEPTGARNCKTRIF